MGAAVVRVEGRFTLPQGATSDSDVKTIKLFFRLVDGEKEKDLNGLPTDFSLEASSQQGVPQARIDKDHLPYITKIEPGVFDFRTSPQAYENGSDRKPMIVPGTYELVRAEYRDNKDETQELTTSDFDPALCSVSIPASWKLDKPETLRLTETYGSEI